MKMGGRRCADGRIGIGNRTEERNHTRKYCPEESVAQREKKILFYSKYNYIGVLQELA